jgi:hypothetical protein
MTMRTPKTSPGNRQSGPEKIPHYRDEDLTQNFPFDLSFISGGRLPQYFPPSRRIYKHFPSSWLLTQKYCQTTSSLLGALLKTVSLSNR